MTTDQLTGRALDEAAARIHVCIAVGFGDDDAEEEVGWFQLPAVPRVGELVYVSFSRMLYPINAGKWTDEAMETAKRFDGTRWLVEQVCWEAVSYGDGRCTVYVKKEATNGK